MPLPNMTSVDSSNIESVAYVDGPQELVIKFKSGGKFYKYFGVPREVYESLVKAPSVGKFFAAQIKSKYRYEQLIPE